MRAAVLKTLFETDWDCQIRNNHSNNALQGRALASIHQWTSRVNQKALPYWVQWEDSFLVLGCKEQWMPSQEWAGLVVHPDPYACKLHLGTMSLTERAAVRDEWSSKHQRSKKIDEFFIETLEVQQPQPCFFRRGEQSLLESVKLGDYKVGAGWKTAFSDNRKKAFLLLQKCSYRKGIKTW